MTPPRPRTETVKIFATADRGMAMGHLDGKVTFVPLAAPGDLVEVEVVREKRRHLETRLLRVLEPSPLRRPAACPHFGACGGCQWQHLPYPDQLAAKDRSFRGFFRSRLGREAGASFREPLASPAEWGYRNRVALKVRAVDGNLLLGYFRQGTHRLVPVAGCPIAHPLIQALIPPLRRFLAGFPPAHGHLPQWDLQVDGNAGLWAIVHLLRPLEPSEAAQLQAFAATHGLAGCYLQSGRKHSLAPLSGDAARLPFTLQWGARRLALGVSPGGFVQANPAVNQALVDTLAGLADRFRGQEALDLYCGAGNFALPLACEAARVTAVEGYPPAAEDARRNALANDLHTLRVLGLPAHTALEQLVREGARPAFALLDPPREGAAEALEPLLALAPAHLCYVSCSPPTLLRDLKVLLARGYRVCWSRIADMFPQTAHVESVTLLRRHDGPGG